MRKRIEIKQGIYRPSFEEATTPKASEDVYIRRTKGVKRVDSANGIEGLS